MHAVVRTASTVTLATARMRMGRCACVRVCLLSYRHIHLNIGPAGQSGFFFCCTAADSTRVIHCLKWTNSLTQLSAHKSRLFYLRYSIHARVYVGWFFFFILFFCTQITEVGTLMHLQTQAVHTILPVVSAQLQTLLGGKCAFQIYKTSLNRSSSHILLFLSL